MCEWKDCRVEWRKEVLARSSLVRLVEVGSGAILKNNLSISYIDVVALVGREGLSCFDECVIEILALVTTAVLDKGENMCRRQEYLLVSVPGKNRWRS